MGKRKGKIRVILLTLVMLIGMLGSSVTVNAEYGSGSPVSVRNTEYVNVSGSSTETRRILLPCPIQSSTGEIAYQNGKKFGNYYVANIELTKKLGNVATLVLENGDVMTYTSYANITITKYVDDVKSNESFSGYVTTEEDIDTLLDEKTAEWKVGKLKYSETKKLSTSSYQYGIYFIDDKPEIENEENLYLRKGESKEFDAADYSKVIRGSAKLSESEGKITITNTSNNYGENTAAVQIGSTKYNIHTYIPMKVEVFDVSEVTDLPGSIKNDGSADFEQKAKQLDVKLDTFQTEYRTYGYDDAKDRFAQNGDWLNGVIWDVSRNCEVPYYSYDLYWPDTIKDKDGYEYYAYRIYMKQQDGDYEVTLNDGEPTDEELQAIADGYHYGYTAFTDQNGENLQELPSGTGYVSAVGYLTIDGERVWCVQPTGYVSQNYKYEKWTDLPEIEELALATIFGDDPTVVGGMYTQALVWENIGFSYYWDQVVFPGVTENMVRIKDGYSAHDELSDSEKAYVENLKAYIEKGIKLYQESPTANFISQTDGVEVEDGVIKITGSELPKTIVLKEQNDGMLRYYENGQVILGDGITGDIDADAGTLPLTLDPDKITSASQIELSMIPANAPKESVLYYNGTAEENQLLAKFGIANPKMETIKLDVNVTPEVSISGKKILNGKKTLEADMFEFELLENGDVLQTATNDADGTINFDTIKYTEEGNHKYTIREKKGNLEGVEYDDTEYTVTVKVTKKTSGELVAQMTYPDSGIVFTNNYSEKDNPPSETNPPSGTPKTGDNSTMYLYVGAFALAIALLITFIARRKAEK